MKVIRYTEAHNFIGDTFDILAKNEAQNNLIMSIALQGTKTGLGNDWLVATVKDDAGSVLLSAVCTPPFNLLIYATGNAYNEAAVQALSHELKSTGYTIPGVLAEQGLARQFAELHAGGASYRRHMSMNIMVLTEVAKLPSVPGFCRPLREDDLFFAPYWEHEFGVDCHVEFYDIPIHTEQLRARLDNGTHYIWEDGFPVSQAVHSRSTLHGAVVSSVYTPPHYRGRGYATACVAHLSGLLLERGNKFCALFADAANPISNGIYNKIGYRDVCVFEELKFE